MTREEVLLEALAASMQREREMAERLIEMEERMEGFQADPSPLETMLARYGMRLESFEIQDIQAHKSVFSPVTVEVRLVERGAPDLRHVSVIDGNQRLAAMMTFGQSAARASAHLRSLNQLLDT